jgi:hypothetical protein
MRKAVRGARTLAVAVVAVVAGCAFTKASPAAADAHASPAAAERLPLLPIPHGSIPWTSNTNAPMRLVPFIAGFYVTYLASDAPGR